MIIEKVGDIRPIGILSILWKVIEKATKFIIEKYAPLFHTVGDEQLGFTAGASILTH